MDTENKKSDFTFVIQGMFHPNTVYAIPYYLMYGDVVVSTWKHSPPLIIQGKIKNETQIPARSIENFLRHYNKESYLERIHFVLDECPSQSYLYKNEIHNRKNCYYQYLSTLNGLNKVKTKYAIKVRSDEIYTDFNQLIDKVKKSDGKKLVTTNSFFRKVKDFPWHPSDHLVACETEHMKKVFQKCLSFCTNGGFFSSEDLNKIKGNETCYGSPYRTRLTKIENKGLVRCEQDFAAPHIWPEMILGMSHLLASNVYIDADKFSKIMKDNFDVVNNDSMGFVQITHSIKNKDTRFVESTNLEQRLREEASLSLRYSMDEIQS